MSTFSIPLEQLAEKAKADLDQVVGAATMFLFSQVVLRSPVGNPDLWKHPAPKGYVGGRFRANWNLSINSPDTSTRDTTESSRGSQEAQRAASFGAGQVVYFCNSLPYAHRLEYESWSQQAPAGMVRVSLTEFDRFMQQAIQLSNSGVQVR